MRRLIILSLLALVFVWTASAGAQTLTGTITGKVTDEQGGVLPGVTVTLMTKQGPTTQVTDAKGEFRFIGLPPGTYSVKSELQGFRPKEQQGLDLSSGKTIDVTLAMTVGGVTEQVDVVASAVVIDTTSTATDTNLSKDLLFTAPMNHAQAYELLNYAPGINGSSAFGGASDTANSLLLDGVDTRDPAGGTPWMFFNYNLLDEVQVGGIGQPAEYGGFTGAVVNSITKSGGNRFSFLSEMRYSGNSLSGDNTSASIKALNPGLAEPAIINKMTDYTVQLGGPIVKDKLFFMANIERYSVQDNPTGPRTIHTEVSPRFNFKVTAQPTHNDRLTFSTQYDQYNQKGRTGYVPAQNATDSQTRTEDAPDLMWNVQYQRIFNSSTFFEAKFTGYSGYYDLNPLDMAPVHYDVGTGTYSGGAGWISKHDRSRNQVNLSLSKYAEFAGTHNFKFGAEIERSTVRDRFQYSGGLYFYDYNGPYMAYGYSYDIKGKNARESFYAQDQWKFGRFSANLGVRGDHIKGEDQVTGKVLYSTMSVAPRLGLVYDLSGKGTSVVRAFYGQLYDGAIEDGWYRAAGGMSDFYEWEVGPNWHIITPPVTIIPAVNKYSVATNLKQPRTDEVSFSWEQQLNPTMKFTATGIYRDSKNFINSVLIGGVWTPFSCSTSPACIPTTTWTGPPITMYKWANKSSTPQFLIQNVDTVTYQMSDGSTVTSDQSRNYKGLMLVLTRNMKDRWHAQLSYVLSKTNGNISNTGEAGVSSGQFETPNGALVNTVGLADYDRRHEIKVFAGYQVPKVEILLDAYFRGVSGYNYTPYASINKKYTNWTGSLTTLLAARGSLQVPFEKDLTLRMEKVLKYGSQRFGLYADVDNLFNWGVVTGVVGRVSGTSILGVTVPYQTPTALIPARQATLGVRWSF